LARLSKGRKERARRRKKENGEVGTKKQGQKNIRRKWKKKENKTKREG
jgi:hypothetical protein